MSSISAPVLVSPQDLYISSSTQQGNLGMAATTRDGRRLRYTYAGGTALVPGTLVQASAEVTANQNLTAVAAVAGATTLVSTSTVTVTANQYANGYAFITVTPGLGYQYQIASHAAFTGAAPTFTLVDPIVVALTTASRIDLVANPFQGVVINPTTATSAPVGVAITATPINNYGWIQTGGTACVLADGTVVVGTSLVASNGTAGAAEAMTGVQALVGTALTGIATTEYGAVYLLLD